MQTATLVITALLLIGLALRTGLAPVRRLHLPASVVGGLLGLAIVQCWSAATPLPLWLGAALRELRGWPTPLIAIVFAGLLLEKPDRSIAARSGDVLRQGAAAWIVVLGQVLIGVTLTWLWVRPSYGVPAAFGQLIEVGMAGGPGTARAMGEVYAKQFDFAAGVDLGLFVATVGLVGGLLSGVALARFGIRRGWAAASKSPDDASRQLPEHADRPIGTARVRGDVLDPLMLQVLWLVAAFGIGVALQGGWRATLLRLDDPQQTRQLVDQLAELPLFVFTTFGGLILRECLRAARLDHLVDPPTLRRLAGVALEVVIVASLVTVSLSVIGRYLLPVLLMLGFGFAWCAFNLLWVSPRLLPRHYWFELGLMNYGFATATTPQSMLLLKLVDRDLKSGAAEAYAAAVPLSAPFVGGGLLTFVGFPLLMSRGGEGAVALICTVAIVGLWIVGRRLRRADARAIAS